MPKRARVVRVTRTESRPTQGVVTEVTAGQGPQGREPGTSYLTWLGSKAVITCLKGDTGSPGHRVIKWALE